ncbi:MAG: RNA polymerase sigma factor [Steroidobacterales bacterium]
MHASIALSGPTHDEDDPIAAAVAAQGPRLRAFVRRQVADLSEVDDIVQDTWVQFVSAYRLMEPVAHVAAWLQRVARNRIIDRFRQRSRDEFRISPDATGMEAECVAAPGEGPEASYARDVLAERLVAAINELPAEQRAVFVANELDGRRFKDLAAEMGVGVNTLLGRKHAAVQFLRQRLQGIRSELDNEE